MRTKEDLRQMQALPLGAKISMTKNRVREWVREYGEDGVYISFSGGKDSTVLLHIVRSMYPDIEAVFVNTGLEYPEIQKFVKSFDNVTILRPEMRFDEVVKKYGYPLISKEVSGKIHEAKSCPNGYAAQSFDTNSPKIQRYGARFDLSRYKPLLEMPFKISDDCCNVMKKAPAKKYEKKTGKKPFIATMASESGARLTIWEKYGCNAFDKKRPSSQPLSFWTEQDILQYIKQNNIPIASVYGQIEYEADPEQMRLEDFGFTECGTERLATTGCDRTGCIFCAFGCHLDGDPSRFQRLKETHPRQYQYCIGGGEYIDGVWQPNKKGLGMGHVFDELNKIYGDGFIKY